MNLETSKKVLRIAGILSIIGAVFMLIFGIIAVTSGGFVATSPDSQADASLQEDAAVALVGGIIFLVVGILSFIEGIVSYRAGKTGRKGLATAAMVFAALSTISQISNLIRGSEATSIVSQVISIAINVLVIYAAYIVRQNAEA